MRFLQERGHKITVESGSAARSVSDTASVGAIGNFDQVVRIGVTTVKSSRKYYYDLVVGSRSGSERGFSDADEREQIALQRTLTAADVTDKLRSLGYRDVTLLFRGVPMSPDIKKAMMEQSKLLKLKPMPYQLLQA